MPTFPDNKLDILVFAAKVAAGINNNPIDYPQPPFDAATMMSKLAEATSLMAERQDKDAEAKDLLERENAKVEEIRVLLRQNVDQAETIHGNDAAKLQEIDWDVRADPKHLIPGQARNLQATHQAAGEVELDWNLPVHTATTGKPTIYKITRETRNMNPPNDVIEPFGTWQTTEFKTKAALDNQPRGVEIRYRVTASNTNGDGPPIDAELVVL